jgi:hypothetical protein
MECLQEQNFSIFETPSEILHSSRHSLAILEKSEELFIHVHKVSVHNQFDVGIMESTFPQGNKGKQNNVQSILCQDVLKNECSIDPLSRCSKEQIMFN